MGPGLDGARDVRTPSGVRQRPNVRAKSSLPPPALQYRQASHGSFSHQAVSILRFAPDILVGASEAIWDMGKGIWTILRTNPIVTAKGIYTLAYKLATEPATTLNALGSALIDPYVIAIRGGRPGKALGRGIVEIGSLFITPGDLLSFARGGTSFSGTMMAGLKAGHGVRQTLNAAGSAGRLAVSANYAARNAQLLAHMGQANEALVMAQYASQAFNASRLGRAGQLGAVAKVASSLGKSSPVMVAGTKMTYGQFFAKSAKLLGVRRFTLVSGHVSRSVYVLEKEARAASTAVNLAERIMAAGATNPGVLTKLGRFSLRNPQVLAPLTPLVGKVPDLLGKIDALPTNLPAKEGLTEESAREIANRYNLKSTLSNVRDFVAEVSKYHSSAIGPDTGSPDQVKQLQVLLRGAKFDVLASGVWDRATANAVVNFKRSRNMVQTYRLANGEFAVNGYADERVINALLAAMEESITQSPI